MNGSVLWRPITIYPGASWRSDIVRSAARYSHGPARKILVGHRRGQPLKECTLCIPGRVCTTGPAYCNVHPQGIQMGQYSSGRDHVLIARLTSGINYLLVSQCYGD